ncbi:ABC transporter permease [Paenibacillus aquistagni]|uniref:ABC-2 type transport system permease protein n=1 Tax=Paenibacillus aquistagni TaxID=1852522 RepID=A0A1X7IWX3_9BACL|nr:ABC transporter permease [Paenibacillus aquistagni]NMM50954.1 ABC transporter permease [Paenibacillus aquistagni]SMG19382.1 ABC-2 type transport system permease protein [Paenibacillus aquistagni]
MRSSWAILRLRFQLGLQYRAAALAGLATQLFFGFIFIMVFEAFYAFGPKDPGMTLEQVITYSWLKQAFLSLMMLWIRDNELFQLITSGNIAYELCRPCRTYDFWYAKLLGQRLASAALRCLPILIIVLFLPAPYGLTPPADAASLLLFFIALMVGTFMVVAISMLIYISVFVTMNPSGSILLFAVFSEFLAGFIIPVPLMPEWMQRIVYMLPFHYTVDFPLRIFTGHIPKMEAIQGIGMQLIWLSVLVLLGAWLMKRILRKVVVQGG